MVDHRLVYELIYALAARDGRVATLFGSSAPYAHEAFARGLCCDAFPELWFELPLLGDPWFDLHMLVSRKDVSESARFAGLDGSYADALAWFARSKNTRQLALSFDTGRGVVEHPATQLLINRKDHATTEAFLAATGRADLTDAYRAFVTAMPRPWYACYTGVFPARAAGADNTPWVRVECLVRGELQRAYAEDADLLRAHLAQVGFDAVDETLVPRIQTLARSPYSLEFQFNVGRDGRALPTLSASLRFSSSDWQEPDGIMAQFAQAQAWGLADERWQEVARTIFSKGVRRGDKAISIYCYPAFIKLRWHDGRPLDAKTYLLAGAV